ncbi:MAG: hypothetical protein FWB78_08120 [Treponema sp.]|nr:hypothetical protein [Treponema sp.]
MKEKGKRKSSILVLAMLGCVLVGVLAGILQPTVPPLDLWGNREVWQTEFDPEAGQTHAEFVVMREAYIVDYALAWMAEADSVLRTTFRSIVLGAISTIAFVVFLICLAMLVVRALVGRKRETVAESVARPVSS